ncbi:MAG: lipopolysaccharide heptosyltransferase family protein [Proteobacteria bacterium]|nr:lipopolysaccharide heptosyltransferase family protein [Pseudomonadota bacterium]
MCESATGEMLLDFHSDQVVEINKIKRVLICRPNQRLGNLLLLTPLIQEIENMIPAVEIDIIVKGQVANCLFQNYRSVKNIIQLPKKPFISPKEYFTKYKKAINDDYDLVINAVENSSSGRIITRKSKGKHKISGKINKFDQWTLADYKHIAKAPVIALRQSFYKACCSSIHGKKIPCLNLLLDQGELLKGAELLYQITGNHNKTICLFTFATDDKLLCKSWWDLMYKDLREEFFDFNIIEVLPMENVSQIDFKVPHFYGKDIRELASLMAACDVFLGTDSGIMHLASAANTPTIGLFSTTDEDIYRPLNHLSCSINVTQNDNDAILKQLNRVLNST